jgi:hypothetical protein
VLAAEAKAVLSEAVGELIIVDVDPMMEAVGAS